MKASDTERMMAAGLMSAFLLTALPAFAQDSDVASEILDWQQELSREILSGGNNAMEAITEDTQKQLRFRLKQEAEARLQRLGQELKQQEYRYTTVPAGKMPELARMPVPGPRSAAVLSNGSELAGDIPWQTTR